MLSKFSLRLIIPVILTIAAFILSMYLIFIPTLENKLISEKKEMIRELTQASVSILEEYHRESATGIIPVDSARLQAFRIIESLRYGEENKDYFWITNMEPRMLVHPFRPDLEGQLLDAYSDPEGKKLFVESVAIVQKSRQGYLDYFWQWKDDSTRIVPKLSYVEGFAEWGLIVGTGIYLNDVYEEIAALKNRLTWVSLGITLFITLILFFVIRTGLRIETLRQKAEQDLQQSREKYRSLVEASREGTILSLDGRVNYVNTRFLERFGYDESDLMGKEPGEILSQQGISTADHHDALRLFTAGSEQVTHLETNLLSRAGEQVPVMLTVSKIRLGEKEGCIFVVREMSASDRLSKQIHALSDELQTSLLFMNQPVKLMARTPLTCSMDTPVRKCAELMMAGNQDAILITGPEGEHLGIITDRDLRNRVLIKNPDLTRPAYSIMTSPLITISPTALLYEAMIAVEKHQVTHIGLADQSGRISGLLSHTGLLHLQQNTTSFLMKMIGAAQSPEELISYSQRTIGMVQALEQSGAKTRNITRIITAITDALTQRFCTLASDQLGQPPADFAFLSLGSEGRGEQTLATDQDNALIYDDVDPADEIRVRNYCIEMGKKITHWLHLAGYERCPGNVMASNPVWVKSLSRWKTDIAAWMKEPSPQAVMEAGIFMDFKMVCGNPSLSEELQRFVDHKIKHEAVFFYHSAQEALRFKAGDLSDPIDLKKVIFPITNFARLFALRNQIHERNTFSRLSLLQEAGVFPESFIQKVSEGYDFLMMLRYRSQLRQIGNNKKPDNKLEIKSLSPLEQSQLKKVLPLVSDIQNRLKQDFNL